MDGARRFESKDKISNHVPSFYKDLFSKEEWVRPSLDNLEFSMIDEASASWLEKNFDEEEVKAAVFELRGDKALDPNGFPIAFFQFFWETIKQDVMQFMREFHKRGKLSKHIGASFITLIAKKVGAESIKDFRPISLIGSIYKVLAKVLATRLQKVLPTLFSDAQGAFVHGGQMLAGC